MWSGSKDKALRERAAEVIPNGMYGHMSTVLMPEDYPQFFTRAEGTRIWDADGNCYIDYMCAYGPNLLGYGRSEVMDAIRKQQAKSDTTPGPAPVMVELAEAMVAMISHADWAMFCKNGSDATMMALMIARAFRGKRKVLVAKNAYHGAMPWNTPRPAGTLPEDRAHVITFDYNDTESLADAVREAGDDLAGIFAAPFRHDTFADQSLPDAEYARTARKLCDERDALLIVDDVRAGLRVTRDCSWETVGVRPDLSAWGKVLGNGQPISSLVGNDRARKAAGEIFVTGSFWFSAVPMAAALATLKIVNSTDYLERMQDIGDTFRAGLCAQANDYGFALRHTGPSTLPMVLFEEDPDLRVGYGFCREAMQRGVYFSPYHNMFINAAMTEQDIAETLEATGAAFEAIKRSRNSLKPSAALAALMGG